MVYKVWSEINVHVFPGFQATYMHKTQQITDKPIKHNGRKVFLRISAGGVKLIVYALLSLHFSSSLFVKTSFFY